MKITRDLRLVIPVETEFGTSYVHASAISREVFEEHFDIISRTFAELYKAGIAWTSGPRVAAMYLRQIAKELRVDTIIDRTLIAEIRRLANVATIRQEGGYQMIPFDSAMATGKLDRDEASEVENALVFFTLAYCMHKKSQRQGILETPMDLWAGRLTSSDYTEFVASLPISTPAASSGATTQTASSGPGSIS